MCIMASKKYVRDVIYGFIELDEQEQAIINHPIFQRLRRIKQLAFTDMVYPGACHTRFEHSLGVMQMATNMYDHIIDNSTSIIQSYLGSTDFDIAKKRFRKIVRIATLLHDIGHAPFSHAGEELMPKRSDNKCYDHENYGVAAIKHYFKTLIEDTKLGHHVAIKVTDITALLDKNEAAIYGNVEHLFFRQIISSQIDADRADYLLRDSTHIGVSYGHYDMPRLINCLTVKMDKPSEGEQNGLVLAIDKKGQYVAESLVIARYQMFNQVYCHKVRRIYDYHITEAIKEVLPTIGHENQMFPPPDAIDEYMKLDDWTVLGAINKNQEKEHCKRMHERLHYKEIYTTKDKPTITDYKQIEKLKKEHPIHYIDRYEKIYWYKPDKQIWIAEGDKISPLQSQSPFIKGLIDPNRQVFYTPTRGK